MNSQRVSGYERKPNDLYETPAWCTHALLPHISLPENSIVYDPAAGGFAIVHALKAMGWNAIGTDITIDDSDFLKIKRVKGAIRSIITNPPYGLAEEFIAHAIQLMKPKDGLVAMLLRSDYDHAATRRYLFEPPSPFAKRIVLTKRIRWFAELTGSPSFNHAWVVWDWKHCGPPIIEYAP